MASLSVETILEIYTATEIDQNIERLKTEMKNLYSSASAGGKSGARAVETVRADLEAFGQARRIKSGVGGLVQTQANFNNFE